LEVDFVRNNEEGEKTMKKNRKIYFAIIVLCLVIVLSSCEHPTKEEIEANNFSIYLTTLDTAIKAEKDPNWTLDVLQDKDYVITDDQIVSYDWERQLLILDDSVQDTFVNDLKFLMPFTGFAIVWNDEIVAQGEVIDIGGPYIPQHSFLYVIEPVGDPEYSIRRTLSSHHSDFASVEDFTVVLRTSKDYWEENVSEFIFEESMAKEIETYFRYDGRLVD
jgi:hypothetical protein